MVKDVIARAQKALCHARRFRTGERGAVVFVVLLVLAVLTAIGVFAARIAGLNHRLSGYDRQSTQTGYVSEYGMLAAIDEMSTESRSAYIEQMNRGTERCESNRYVDGGVGLPCYRIYMGELQQRLAQDPSQATLFDPDGGSLGNMSQGLSPDFVVEMTDPGPAGRPVAGMDQGGTGPRFRYMQITFSSIGQVRPVSPSSNADAGVCVTPEEQQSAQVAGTRATRAIVQVGPVPE